MSTITSANLGNGNGSYTTDIVVKDLDMTVSNYVKDRTPLTNMAMSKKRKVNSTLHIWPVDYYRTPALNAKLEGAAVSAAQAAEIQYALGFNAAPTIASQGFYLQISEATAETRAARLSPPITLYYQDGEAVQQITMASIAIQ